MTDDRRRTLWEYHAEAISRYLQPRSVSVVGFYGDVPGYGSGTCVTIADRFFIATVAHHIKHYPMDQLFIIHSHEYSQRRIPIIGYGYEGGGDYDPTDVAWLEISYKTAQLLGKEFICGREILPSISFIADDYVVVHGYPGERNDEKLNAEGGQISVQPMAFITSTIQPSDKGHNPAIDLVLEYPNRTDYRANGWPIDRLPEAPGLSGGGIWTVNVNDSGVWSPSKIRLIGIQNAWKKYDYLLGNQIQVWLELLRRDIPELDSELSLVIP